MDGGPSIALQTSLDGQPINTDRESGSDGGQTTRRGKGDEVDEVDESRALKTLSGLHRWHTVRSETDWTEQSTVTLCRSEKERLMGLCRIGLTFKRDRKGGDGWVGDGVGVGSRTCI